MELSSAPQISHPAGHPHGDTVAQRQGSSSPQSFPGAGSPKDPPGPARNGCADDRSKTLLLDFGRRHGAQHENSGVLIEYRIEGMNNCLFLFSSASWTDNRGGPGQLLGNIVHIGDISTASFPGRP